MSKDESSPKPISKPVYHKDALSGSGMQKATGVNRTGERALRGGAMPKVTNTNTSTTSTGHEKVTGAITGPAMQKPAQPVAKPAAAPAPAAPKTKK